MANIRLSTAARNAMLDAITARMDLGAGPATLKIYSGSQPPNGDAAESGTLLATLTFSNPAAGGAASGVLTFDAITEDSAADASNTATWARIEDSNGNNVFDGDVNSSGAMINLNTTAVVAGGPVRINSFTITIPASISF